MCCHHVIYLTTATILEDVLTTYLDDTGVISATLVSIGSDLSRRALTTLDKSLISK